MILQETISIQKIWSILEEVYDPEIPVLSIVDLGIVTGINITDENVVNIALTPTFSGCPALKYMEDLVKERIEKLRVKSINVTTNFDIQWNTDMITEKGKEMLKKHGLAPPLKHNGLVQIEMLYHVKCPHCGSKDTTLNTPFGPTLCRSIHYCNNCKQAFEQFKPVA